MNFPHLEPKCPAAAYLHSPPNNFVLRAIGGKETRATRFSFPPVFVSIPAPSSRGGILHTNTWRKAGGRRNRGNPRRRSRGGAGRTWLVPFPFHSPSPSPLETGNQAARFSPSPSFPSTNFPEKGLDGMEEEEEVKAGRGAALAVSLVLLPPNSNSPSTSSCHGSILSYLSPLPPGCTPSLSSPPCEREGVPGAEREKVGRKRRRESGVSPANQPTNQPTFPSFLSSFHRKLLCPFSPFPHLSFLLSSPANFSNPQ